MIILKKLQTSIFDYKDLVPKSRFHSNGNLRKCNVILKVLSQTNIICLTNKIDYRPNKGRGFIKGLSFSGNLDNKYNKMGDTAREKTLFTKDINTTKINWN